MEAGQNQRRSGKGGKRKANLREHMGARHVPRINDKVPTHVKSRPTGRRRLPSEIRDPERGLRALRRIIIDTMYRSGRKG